MNDIDHEPTERAGWETKVVCSCGEQCSNWMQFYRHRGDSYRDAIEKAQQWETIARRAEPVIAAARMAWRQGGIDGRSRLALAIIAYDEADEAAFRDLADRTPTPTDGA